MLSAHEVQVLLDRLCIDHGFCLTPAARARIEEHPPTTPKGFIDAGFFAEGFDPMTADRSLYRTMKQLVDAAFRASEIAHEPEDFGDE